MRKKKIFKTPLLKNVISNRNKCYTYVYTDNKYSFSLSLSLNGLGNP